MAGRPCLGSRATLEVRKRNVSNKINLQGDQLRISRNAQLSVLQGEGRWEMAMAPRLMHFPISSSVDASLDPKPCLNFPRLGDLGVCTVPEGGPHKYRLQDILILTTLTARCTPDLREYKG